MFKAKLLFLCLVLSLLMFSGLLVRAEEGHIVIFHTTDTHGRVVTDDKTIGLDLIAGIVRQTPNAVLVDTGDYLMGLPAAAMTQGKDIIALMKLTGYFAAAIGNHEFDHGPDALMQRYTEATAEPRPMRMISANIRGKDGKLLFPPEADTSVDGVKLCFFGLTTQGSKFSVSPMYSKDITFDDVVECALSTARKQRAEGCDIVVALSHVGSGKEVFATSRDIAKLPGIDIIIDGHSHVRLNEQTPAGGLLVSSGAHGRHLGRLDIVYDKAAKKIISMKNTVISRELAGAYAPDETVAKALEAMTLRLDKELARPVGRIGHSLNGSRQVLRAMEAPLGRLFADAMRQGCPSDISLVNGGGLRDGLKKGEVTMEDIVRIVPFRDRIVTVRVTGRELKQVLEFGFSHLPDLSGAFPHLSGIVVRLDPERAPGERILSINLEDGRPLDPDGVYVLATNDYVAKGGDGYPTLSAKPIVSTCENMQQASVEFFKTLDPDKYKGGPAERIIFVKLKAE